MQVAELMTTLSDSELAALISPFENQISGAILKAWSTWLENPQKHIFCARTRANMIWDIATKALEEELDPLPGIHVNRSANTCIFMIGQQLAFRFKKADEKGVSSNYPTPMALAFHDPEQIVLGIPEAIKTEVIYVLNKLETEINHIKLVRRNGASVAWSLPMYERRTAKLANIVAVDTVKTAPRKRRVSIKREVAETMTPAVDAPAQVKPSK